jgi:hypothetical protein
MDLGKCQVVSRVFSVLAFLDCALLAPKELARKEHSMYTVELSLF